VRNDQKKQAAAIYCGGGFLTSVGGIDIDSFDV
jgi:hypothetical protein